VDSEKGAKSGVSEEYTDPENLTPQLNAGIIRALFKAEVQEKRLARKVVGLQALTVLAAAGVAYGWKGSPQYAIAVLGGGGVSVLNGALLAWRMSRAALHSAQDAHQQLRLMYFYAAERFSVVIALLAICLAVLKFSPLMILGGFVIGQAALLAGRLFLKIKTEDSD
jgi:F0F1-type ATP synthase assembly protein I